MKKYRINMGKEVIELTEEELEDLKSYMIKTWENIEEFLEKIKSECPYLRGYIDGQKTKEELEETEVCQFIVPQESFLERVWNWLVDSMIFLGEHGDKMFLLILGTFITIIVLALAGVVN